MSSGAARPNRPRTKSFGTSGCSARSATAPAIRACASLSLFAPLASSAIVPPRQPARRAPAVRVFPIANAASRHSFDLLQGLAKATLGWCSVAPPQERGRWREETVSRTKTRIVAKRQRAASHPEEDTEHGWPRSRGRRMRLGLCLVLTLVASVANAQSSAPHGMVVAQEARAAEIGADVLKRGGNAVDAAVATAFALAVTHPRAGNLGGGGYMLIHLAGRHADVAIDYRETAPAATTRDIFLGPDGKADPRKSRDSALGIGVPGTVAGLALAHARFGSGKFRLDRK